MCLLILRRRCIVVSAAVVVSFGVIAKVAHGDEFPEAFNTQEITEPLLSPQEALDAISVPDGFNLTLYAAEPHVRQPIALATDERGRLWVVENYTYAESKVNFETEKQRDRVLIFEDTDGSRWHWALAHGSYELARFSRRTGRARGG